MNIISNDGSNKLNRSRKARVSYKVQRTINASLNAATSTRAVSSNPNFVTRQKIKIIFGFSRSGWLWPVDAKGEPLKATSYMAVGFYVAKYVNKKSDMDLAAKGLGAKEWNNSLKTKLSLLPKKLFRIRMSRNFGMKMLTMTNLSTECLIQLTKLGYDATPFNQI